MWAAFFRAAEAAKAQGRETFTVLEDQRPARLVLKALAATWIGYKLGDFFVGYGERSRPWVHRSVPVWITPPMLRRRHGARGYFSPPCALGKARKPSFWHSQNEGLAH